MTEEEAGLKDEQMPAEASPVHNPVIELLKGRFPEIQWFYEESYGMTSVHVPKDHILEVLEYLRNDPDTGYGFLTDLCGMHVPADPGKELGVIYHLHNLRANKRLRVKCFFAISSPKIPSVTALWAGANWMERETYDFFGVEFTGHPDLRRILNVDHMDYFPLRKEYHLEDATRTDKKDRFFGRNE